MSGNATLNPCMNWRKPSRPRNVWPSACRLTSMSSVAMSRQPSRAPWLKRWWRWWTFAADGVRLMGLSLRVRRSIAPSKERRDIPRHKVTRSENPVYSRRWIGIVGAERARAHRALKVRGQLGERLADRLDGPLDGLEDAL